VSGIPCPFDGNNLNYVLTFDISQTKPGCTQQWFAVNLDTFADPNAFIPYNAGLLAPPPPGIPIPFVLPYDIVGNRGTQFVKGYTPGQIGDPYARNPIGSFALGLIVGNGKPDPNGGPPACLDTFYYPDLFRILPLDASFDIVYPTPISTTPLQYYMCPGDTAYYRITNPIQDSVKTLRWAWGYQGLGKGPNLSIYVEEFKYYQPYTGPKPNRNDKNIVYNGEDWLYNYVVRRNIDDVLGEEIIDTIVTSIIKDWKVVAIKTNTDQLIKDAFEQLLNLSYNEIPAEDIPYYLGDGTYGCLDTTGISALFQFGKEIYSDKTGELGVTRVGDKIFRTDTSVTPNVQIETQHIIHFRDSSMQGFDTLMLDTNFDGKKDMLTGLYRHIYKYPVITNPDECNPGVKDTIYKNGSGPMAPSLFLNSTPGCEARSTKLINVGFYNDFWVSNENLCQGLNLVIEDSLRYYQYGEQDPFTYPIHDFPLWQTRYLTNEETYRADWDNNDGQFDSTRSIILNHTYTDPGEYTITVVAEDSIGCTDTTLLTVFVSKVLPGFDFGSEIVNCASIINFQDTSSIIDPCAAKDTCKNGTDLSCEKIIAWEWDFGDGTRKSILQNPSHNYTSGGTYTVMLTVTTQLGCIDSIKRQIFIPGPQPQFEFDNDVWNINDTAVICVNDLVNLKNTSQGDVSDPKFQIIWGDGSNDPPGDIDSVFGHVYTTPGTYELFLIQEDEIPGTGNRCSRIFPDTNPDLLIQRRIVVIVNPRPEVEITASDTVVCPDDPITFTGILDDRYIRLKWFMGYNDDEINENVPDTTVTYSYPNPGVYEVILAPEYDELPRCWDRDTISVRVVDVKASFDIDSSARPEFCFTNTSTGAISYKWTFEENDPEPDGTSEETDPCYNWDERKGVYQVCLTATSSEGCEDDTCQTVSNTFLRRLVPYNVFTPNSTDDKNTEFVIEGESLDEYEIKIFNRWGESVFKSTDINNSWNGRVDNTGEECPEGTYFYIINYTFKFGEKNEGKGPIEGSVDLIRN
jgi:gliding motility-associated-like protein